MARGSGDRILRQRRERKLAVVLANSCREAHVHRQGAAPRGGLLAMAVPVLLFLLGLLALAGMLREYFV